MVANANWPQHILTVTQARACDYSPQELAIQFKWAEECCHRSQGLLGEPFYQENLETLKAEQRQRIDMAHETVTSSNEF